MLKKRINACWLLLLTLLYTASLVLSVGETQARYNNTVVTKTLVGGQESGITSNCLITNRDPAVTVLAGEMNLYSSTTASFWLHSSGANATGTLRWGVSNPEYAQYVRIRVQSGADVIKPESDIELLEDVPMELTLIITPTEAARNSVHEELKIHVVVTWGDSHWGTFQVILPEVKGEPEKDPSEENTEPVETQPATVPEETLPETEPEQTQPATESEETRPETEPEQTQPATEPEETQPVTEPEETEPATEAATEPETEPKITVTVVEPQETKPQLQTETEPVYTQTPEETTASSDREEVSENKNQILDAITTVLGIGKTEDTEQTTPDMTNPSEATVESTAAPETEPSTEMTTALETQPAAEATTEPETEPATEPATEPETQPATEPTVQPVTEPATEPTEPEEVDDKDPIRIETLGKFDSNGMLPVNMAMTKDVTSVRLGLAANYEDEDEDPENTLLEVLPLPRHTRFSLNGGESYYMLAESCVAEFNVNARTELPLLLDFRYTGLADGTGIRLVMDAYAGEALAVNCAAKTICSAPAASLKSMIYDKKEYQASLAAAANQTSTEEEPVKLVGLKDSWILNQSTVLELTLPKEWQEAELLYNIELLTTGEDNQLAYKRIDPEASGLVIAHNDNERDHNLVLMIGDKLPQAGTYRINMEWTYKGICFIRKQTTFFINYAADAGYLLGGLEVSKND